MRIVTALLDTNGVHEGIFNGSDDKFVEVIISSTGRRKLLPIGTILEIEETGDDRKEEVSNLQREACSH